MEDKKKPGKKVTASVVVLTAMIVCILAGFLAPFPDMKYEGIATLPVEEALLLQLERSSGEIAIVTYNPGADTVYIAYKFHAWEEGLYGLESEKDIWVRIVTLSVAFVSTVVAISILGMFSGIGWQ